MTDIAIETANHVLDRWFLDRNVSDAREPPGDREDLRRAQLLTGERDSQARAVGLHEAHARRQPVLIDRVRGRLVVDDQLPGCAIRRESVGKSPSYRIRP